MTAERTGSQQSRLGKDISTQNAALRGASLAFGKPPVKPKPQINNYAGKDGALAAATKAGGHSRQASRSRGEGLEEEQRLGHQNTGSSVGAGANVGYSERGMVQQRLNQLGAGNFLQLPRSNGDQSKSPSFIAATLAASRSASVSPNPTGNNRSSAELRRPASFIARSPSVRSVSSSRESSDQALDTTPIPPTTSLIGMFEQNSKSPTVVKGPALRRAATSAVQRRSPGSEHVGSPPPPRSRTPQPLSAQLRKPEIKSPKPLPAQIRSIPKSLEPSEPTVVTQKQEARSSKPALPNIKSSPRGKNASIPPLVAQEPGTHPPKPSLARIQSFPKAAATPPQVTQRPPITAAKAIPIPSKSQPSKAEDDDDASSDESFVSASDYQPSFRAALSMQNRRLTSTSAVSVNSVAVDSLANAIVASSLASSRAASPSRQQSLHANPPLPPRRNGRNHLFHNPKDISRTPSPSKPGQLRTTMRKPKSKDEIDEGERRRSRKHLMKKHPNKHHEGDRKRWRDTITERERKRYEAVWASNKGLFAPSNAPADEMSVCNLVARDIFSRSRLHVDVLEEVYSLVDRQGNGRLEKEEFVVGLWLIDQRLKGRKLPIKVTESVWKSVGILGGIKVRKVHH
jgi:hypothetical protein